MRYWYDTEFIEDGKTIDLISIGIVAEDGREYYAQSCEFDENKASQWVKDNVVSHLVYCERDWRVASINGDKTYHVEQNGCCLPPDLNATCPWRTREQIKQEILAFMDTDVRKYGTPELWGYYSAYDHVVFCQLFGTMMDLPKGFPMYTNDIEQAREMLGCPSLPKQEGNEHNALADARWNKVAYDFLANLLIHSCDDLIAPTKE